MLIPKFYMIPLAILVTALAASLSACQPAPAAPTAAALPNPASVYCEQNGRQLELRPDAAGAVAGICIFPDGSECDEWAYFRGECAPSGDSSTASPHSLQSGTSFASPAALPLVTEPPEPPEQQPAGAWQLYRSDELGYQFEYPPDTVINTADNPLDSLAITGTDAASEFWPQITLSHPADREEFRPPQDANLEEWLTQHNLLPDERQPDTTIAGTTAVHVRHERSPQSYAFDRYYFAHAGQLYEIVIGHVGDREDWPVYNRFLESFTFDD